jgi:hypothetical protein
MSRPNGANSSPREIRTRSGPGGKRARAKDSRACTTTELCAQGLRFPSSSPSPLRREEDGGLRRRIAPGPWSPGRASADGASLAQTVSSPTSTGYQERKEEEKYVLDGVGLPPVCTSVHGRAGEQQVEMGRRACLRGATLSPDDGPSVVQRRASTADHDSPRAVSLIFGVVVRWVGLARARWCGSGHGRGTGGVATTWIGGVQGG